MARRRRRNTYNYENNPVNPDRVKTPHQFRRDMDEGYIKLMVFLYVIGGYPQHLCYKYATGFEGKPSSLASAASRAFSSFELQAACRAMSRYYTVNPIPVNQKYNVP